MNNLIIIIGAGIGGLSAAIRLAAAGKRVLVLEQNAAVGGKMAEWCEAGFRWDTGPSVITMRHVFEDLFTAAGRHLDDYLTLLPVDPLTRYFYPDGVTLDASSDTVRMTEQIANLDDRDVAGYLAYLNYAAQLHRITGPTFIYDQPPTWRSFIGVPLTDMLKVDAWRTMDKAIATYVHSPHLRQLLGRFATYVGGSPYRAPATLNVIADVEMSGGVWYPHGGIYEIARSFAKVAAELGVEIRTNCQASQLLLDEHGVTGVVLADETQIKADAVIANVDVTTVYNKLLPKTAALQRRLKRLIKIEPSCSGFIMLLGLNKTHPNLAHHNIFFSSDYRQEFDDIFVQGRLPNEPTIYVAITSKTDADHAPQDSENWFILVNAPPTRPDHDWPAQTEVYRDVVLNRLEEFGLEIRSHIAVEHHLTPLNLAQQTGAWRGALYGTSPNSPLTAFRRPHNRAGEPRGLYFVGGTTHPGGGVPMVTLSGKVVAEMILNDQQ